MKFTADWFSHNIPHLEKYLEPYKSEEIRFLEIGCNEGRSTVWFLQNILTNKASKIDVIDTFNNGANYELSNDKISHMEKTFRNNVKELGIESTEKVSMHKGFSREILRNMKLHPIYDVIYIDGSHIASSVMEDAVLSWGLLKEDGLIVFDDYQWGYNGYEWPGFTEDYQKPKIAIDAFIKCYTPSLDVIYSEYQLIIRKTRT